MKARHIVVTFLLLTVFGCKKFEYSPQQEKEAYGDNPVQLNALNLERLGQNEENADDTITFVYSGDSQRYYDELEKLVAKVNTLPNVDFLVMCGDISDFGLLKEYQWIVERMNRLSMPYLCAIGNHDFTANGGEVFTRIFGEKNFSFSYRGYKFIFHDTNGREYGFNGTIPDLGWLGQELSDPAPRWMVGVSHVPPFNVDFDKQLEVPYKNLFASTPNFILSLHGHQHDMGDNFYYEDHVRYLTSNSVEKTQFLLLKLINGKIIKQLIDY